MSAAPAHAAWTARAAPVAIVGIGCRFPGGVDDADSFWRLLIEGRDAITEIPQSRIDLGRYFDPRPATPGRMMTRWGGFLDGIDNFDAGFFRISPREAERMDPQQRLLLETAWEAFEDAGQDLTLLRGARAGVYVGQWLSDFEARLFGDPEAVDFQMTTGSGRYASSGRISYALGLNGPSLTLDTACSSSLVAVHLAVRAIRGGECEVALAGGVNVILQPHISIAYSQSRMMAADGRCKFADARADGYVRSEGAALIVLKPLDRALADADRIYAVIHGSAANNDGCSSGSLGTPSQLGQQELLRAAYADAGRPIGEVGYFEAHGTGTRVGDPVEIGAIATVIGEGDAEPKSPAARAYIGSVKTNIGHCEGAAGIAGLIKTALALHHGTVPPSLHCGELNPAVAWDDTPCRIARAASAWPARDGGRLAGVSAFGISGSNAHVVLGEAPPADAAVMPPADRSAPPRVLQVLALSARSTAALRQLAGAYRARIETGEASLNDLCWSAATRRTPQDYRMAFVASDAAGMIEALRRFEEDTADVAPAADTPPNIAFVVPGQGGQWLGMTRELMQSEPAFRAALMECDAAIRSLVDWSIVEQLAAAPGSDAYRLDRIDVIQPVLVAIAIAYAALWRALGVKPDAIIGHSMGEVGAACISGALDLSSAMRIVCLRSKLMRRTSGMGAMALVDLPMEDVSKRLAGHEDKVSVAAANGPRSVVISGEPQTVQALLADFERENIFSRLINVDVASHSPQMQPLAAELAAELAGLPTHTTRVPFYSTVLGRRAAGEELGADYWARNLREPVRFGATMAQMLADGIDTVIELGPHPILLHSVEDVAQSLDRRVTAIGSGRREEAEQATLLAGLGRLWAAGFPVDWRRLMPQAGRVVALPRHPWARARHWVEAAEMRFMSADAASRPVALDEDTRALLHRLQWVEAPPSPHAASPADVAHWLIACDDAGLTGALAAQLAGGNVKVSITTLTHLETAIAALAAGDAPVGIVLMLPDDADAAYLPLRLLQASESASLAARIFIVSRGAQAVDPGAASPVSVNQAAAWGAARVVAQEHPDRWGGLIDLDPAQAPADAAPMLAAHLRDRDGEDQIALRNGRRFALRVVADSDNDARVAPYAWRRDAAYLITGGLGEVGLTIAKAMVAAGARRLILIGRTPLPPRDTWASLPPDDAAAPRVAAIRALEQAGAAVHVAALDVGDEEALRGFLARYAAEGWPTIAGVIHAAGRFDNHLSGTMTRAQFDAALAPKLRGAQHLDALLPDVDLFVMFSSTGAFQVQPGQANYAAANAGLDALAQDRRVRGRKAQSIAWGVWKDTGLVNNEAGRRNVAEMARQGIGSFAPERGAALFNWLCARDVACPVVLPVDWATFKARHRAGGEPLYRAVQGGAQAAAADLPQQLHMADAAERKRLLEVAVREAVGKVLKLSPAALDPRRTFGAMGLNSLMAIELRNRLEAALGRPLSATLAWNHPTVAALVAHLAGGEEAAPTQPQRSEPVAEPLPDRVTSLAELSDEEVLAALRA